jgi:transcriptional regulator with XRE-family HTH domain
MTAALSGVFVPSRSRSSSDSHISSAARARECANLTDMTLDYASLGREFVRAARGRRSQTALSRRLGYRTNVLYAWEAGRRAPTAATVFRLLRLSRIDVRARLGQFFASPPRWLAEVDPTSAEGVAALLREVRGTIPILELARRTGFSRYAVARWLECRAEPHFADFLRLFEASSLRLLDFIAQFHDPGKLPAAAQSWQLLEAHRRAAYEQPWIPAVLRALELVDYARLPEHEPGFIARRLGISPEEEARCLSTLEETGQIRRRGARYEPVQGITVDTRPDADAERRLKRSWAEIGTSRLAAGAPGLFSFNVFAVSERDLAKLEELHRSYYRHLRAIVAGSAPSERIAVANLQLFALDRSGNAP